MLQFIKCKFFLLVLVMVSVKALAQPSVYITAGTNFFTTAGTNLFIDSLVLKPSVNYNIAGLNSFTEDATAVPPPPTPYIQRVYHLLSTITGYSGDITLYYSDAELNGVAENTLILNVYDGTNWNAYTPATRDGVNNFVSTTGLTNISINQLTLAGLSGPLPIVLSGFSVQVNSCTATLHWITSSEQNSKHFELQESADGIVFTSVATIPASGNSANERNYKYNKSLNKSTTFFRLRLVDIDGSSKLSGVIIAKSNCTKNLFNVFPNPTHDKVFIRGMAIGNRLILLNNLGQVLQNKKVNNSTEQIDLRHFSAGTYIIQLVENGKVLQNFKIIKE